MMTFFLSTEIKSFTKYAKDFSLSLYNIYTEQRNNPMNPNLKNFPVMNVFPPLSITKSPIVFLLISAVPKLPA